MYERYVKPAVEASRRPPAGPPSKNPNIPCKFHMRRAGSCRNGLECPFSHDPYLIAAALGELPPESFTMQQPPRPQRIPIDLRDWGTLGARPPPPLEPPPEQGPPPPPLELGPSP